jgi:hypothetical protein
MELSRARNASKMEMVSNQASRRLLTIVGSQPHTSPGLGPFCDANSYTEPSPRALANLHRAFPRLRSRR